MNKAFVREPDFDGRVFCPRCGSEGILVGSGPLDRYLLPEKRGKFPETAYCCTFLRCDVVYFTALETTAEVTDLARSAYPYDLDAPICACFGLNYDDVVDDTHDSQPTRIRNIVARSKTADARCASLSLDGRCCLAEVQRLYMKLLQEKS